MRPGDQDPEPGELICRLAQSGQGGSWAAEDADGNPLQVTKAGDGTLEIRHAPGNGDEDPDQIRLQSPINRDANAGAPGENLPGQAFEARVSAALAPTRNADQRNPSGLRGLQAPMNSHYRRP